MAGRIKSCPDGQFIQLCSKTTLGVVYDDEDVTTRLTGKIMKVFDSISVPHQGKMVKPRTYIRSCNKVPPIYMTTIICVTN